MDSQGGHTKGHVKGELVRNMEGNPNCVTAEGMLMLLVLLAEGFSFQAASWRTLHPGAKIIHGCVTVQ